MFLGFGLLLVSNNRGTRGRNLVRFRVSKYTYTDILRGAHVSYVRLYKHGDDAKLVEHSRTQNLQIFNKFFSKSNTYNTQY